MRTRPISALHVMSTGRLHRAFAAANLLTCIALEWFRCVWI